MTLDQFQA